MDSKFEETALYQYEPLCFFRRQQICCVPGALTEADRIAREQRRLQALCKAWLAVADITLEFSDVPVPEEGGDVERGLFNASASEDEEDAEQGLSDYHYSADSGFNKILKMILERQSCEFWHAMKAMIAKQHCRFSWCKSTREKYDWLNEQLDHYIRGSQQDIQEELQVVPYTSSQENDIDEAYESDMRHLAAISRAKRHGPIAVAGWTLTGTGSGVAAMSAIAVAVSPHLTWLIPLALSHPLLLLGVLVAAVGIMVLFLNEKYNDPIPDVGLARSRA